MDPAEIEAVAGYAALNFGYQPIFHGLKSGASDWRTAIAPGEPLTAITPLTVEHSLVLLTRDSSPPEPGLAVEEARLEALCSGAPARAADDSASLRLFGLCVLARRLPPGPDITTAAAEAALRLAGMKQVDLAYLSAANDAVFLLRVANRLGQAAPAASFGNMLGSIALKLGSIERQCASGGCPANLDYLRRRADFLKTQVMLALVEQPRLLSPALQAELQPFSRLAGGAAAEGPLADTVSEGACRPLGLTAAECRLQYPYEPALDQHVARMVATFVASDARQEARCARLRVGLTAVGPELSYRNDLAELLTGFLASQCPAISGRKDA